MIKVKKKDSQKLVDIVAEAVTHMWTGNCLFVHIYS